MPMSAINVGEIVDFVGGHYAGDRNRPVVAVASLAEAGEKQLSFLSNRKYAAQLAETKAGAILVPQNLDGEDERWIRVEDPYLRGGTRHDAVVFREADAEGAVAPGLYFAPRQAGSQCGGRSVHDDWGQCGRR